MEHRVRGERRKAFQPAADSLQRTAKNYYCQSKVAACCQLLAASWIFPMLYALCSERSELIGGEFE